MEFRGDQALLDSEVTILVGDRRCSDYGRKTAREYALALSGAGHTVALTLGAGVSAAAAEALVDEERPYIMAISGGLLTPPPPHLATFVEKAALVIAPMRDGASTSARMVRSWDYLIEHSDQMVVIESNPTGEAMEFAWQGIMAGMPLYAVPGPVSAMLSAGPNSLITNGDAQALSNPNMLARGSDSRSVRATSLG